MSAVELLVLLVVIWIGIVLAVRLVLMPVLDRAPGGDPLMGLLWFLVRAYCRLFHRARYSGQEEIRRKSDPGGLIIVSNHTSGVDPLLIQAACRFPVRWMMATDMMIPELDWLWARQNIIPVARDSRDSHAARTAVRHVRDGGVIGIFPEGRIVTHGEVRSFHQGVGLLAAKTGAPVLLVWISGTPQTDSLSRSFITPSRARVVFAEPIHFKTRDPRAITQQLREQLSRISNWPINDEPMPELRIASHIAGRRNRVKDDGDQPMRLTA